VLPAWKDSQAHYNKIFNPLLQASHCSKMTRISLAAVLFASLVASAPTGTSSTPAPTDSSLLGYNAANGVINVDTDKIPYSLAPGQTNAATIGAPLDFSNIQHPQPVRGSKGGLDPGPTTPEYSRLNPDKLAPPGTDHGAVKNAQVSWMFCLPKPKS
jgi:hypothetical protein